MEEWGPCPIFASFTLAFALKLRKKHGKTSVRVRKTSVRLRNPAVRVQYTYYVQYAYYKKINFLTPRSHTSRGLAPYNLYSPGTWWRWVVKLTPQGFPSGKEARYPLNRKLGEPHVRYGRFRQENRTPNRPARSKFWRLFEIIVTLERTHHDTFITFSLLIWVTLYKTRSCKGLVNMMRKRMDIFFAPGN